MGTIQCITEEKVNEDVLRNTCVPGRVLGPRDDNIANPGTVPALEEHLWGKQETRALSKYTA